MLLILGNTVAVRTTFAGKNGDEELFRAACKGDLSKVSAALDAGARVDAQNGKGQTALMCAAEKGLVKAVEALLARGAKTPVLPISSGATRSTTPRLRGGEMYSSCSIGTRRERRTP
jgi:ankyrin repeat protein